MASDAVAATFRRIGAGASGALGPATAGAVLAMKMRYSLRTLLIVMFFLGPVSLWAWPKYLAWREAREQAELLRQERAKAQANIGLLTQQITSMGGGVRSVTKEPLIHARVFSYNEETGKFERLSERDPKDVELVPSRNATEQNE